MAKYVLCVAEFICIICFSCYKYNSKFKQKNQPLLKTFENHSRVNLIYLPPYCPNLNLIERLWKFLYKKVSVCRRYKKFVDFQNAILGFLDNIAQYKDELDTLMTENFNIIRHKNSNFILDWVYYIIIYKSTFRVFVLHY